jgi:hypothetical protein
MFDQPTPFLAQPRAHSALRHQLDAIVEELKPGIERCRSARPEETFELIVLPYRVIARVDDDAVSFSWVSGRFATVADGCLLVIAWSNVPHGVRGVAALKSATRTHERTYVAAGASADEWRWRADDLADAFRSTSDLTADWMARTTLGRSTIASMQALAERLAFDVLRIPRISARPSLIAA